MEETKTNTAGVDETTTTETTTENKTYTADEVQALLQAEVDRRITTAQKKWEKTTADKMKQAERLAAMSEEERSKARIEELQSELAKREKEITVRENKLICISEMEKRNIPTALVDFIVTDDADDMLENLTTFEKTLKQLVNDEVSKRLSSAQPKTSTADTSELTRENFKKLSLAEQNEIYKSNPDLYKKLM